jgi:hypothetical protein
MNVKSSQSRVDHHHLSFGTTAYNEKLLILTLQLKDFLLLFNKLSQNCFQRCVYDMGQLGLRPDEVSTDTSPAFVLKT